MFERWRRWSLRRHCARRGHLWVAPPRSHTFEDCIHLPCKVCDAWRTVHGSNCPDGLNARTTMRGVE